MRVADCVNRDGDHFCACPETYIDIFEDGTFCIGKI